MKQSTDRLGLLANARADAFETARDGFLVLDPEGRVLALNAAARRVLGLPGTQALGQLAYELISGPAELAEHPWRETAAPLPVTLGEGEAQGRYELSIVPMLTPAGKPLGQRVTLCHVPDLAAAPDASDNAVWNLNPPVKTAALEQTLRRDTILEAVALAAEQFLKNTGWELALPAVLARLGQATGVSHVRVLEWKPNLQAAVLTSLHREWMAPAWAAPLGRRPAFRHELPLGPKGLRRWHELLSTGKPVYGSTADFPEPEQRWLAERAILATLCVPVFAGPRWWGVMAFDDHGGARMWLPSDVESLQTTASLLGAAIQLEQAFLAMRESEARSRALVDAFPDTIYQLTRDGRIINFKGEDDFGQPFAPEHFVGRPVGPTLPPKAAPVMLEHIVRALETRQLQTFEYVAASPGGTDRHFEARVAPCGPDEVVAIVRNVSERARLEQMKSDFIHRAAHDLRTPLTTASLAASIIQEGGTPEELEQYWKILRTELARQRELIEELLTMGRLESGTFQMILASVEIEPLLRETVEIVGPLAEKRTVTLQTAIAPDLPLVIGDRNSLQQVFINLLDNAIKFSAPGKTVDMTAAAKAEGVSVSVSDHGMGIPPEDLPNLFERFFRARNAIEDEVQGTGVGLFIAKAIVDQLNGHIDVESELNRGTTFEVWLPAQGRKPA